MASVEEDPKITARDERRSPEVEKLMRQFTQIDGPKGTTKEYRRAYDRVFREKRPAPFAKPIKCHDCPYLAEDLWDLEWHEDQTHHEFPHV